MNKYIGHQSQLCGVREARLSGGKADGMRALEVYNASKLRFTVSLDRGGDIPYLFYDSKSMSYIAPCGMAAPQYYEKEGAGFLKSFTAGFLTTCGLTAVGSPCVDDGESLPLHGTVSHIPCEQFSYDINDESITVNLKLYDAALFSHKLMLERKYICGMNDDILIIRDKVTNIGSKQTPYMILYHCNFGYPLLCEKSRLEINSTGVAPRDARAEEGIAEWNKILTPQADFTEQCYYHTFSEKPRISLSNPEIKTEMTMTFSDKSLDCFTQWKMMGEYEYVMGLEPGNCLPDGRDVMREKGILKFLAPGESAENEIRFEFKKLKKAAVN